MTLSKIIEKKKEEFDTYVYANSLECGGYDDSGMLQEDIEKVQSFLEKAIRESVEEALRDVRPQPSYSKTNWKTCLDEFDVRVNEFMK